MKTILFAVTIVTLYQFSDALRCYDYTRTSLVKNNMKTWIDCPVNTMFCYKSYLETRDFNNDKTLVEGRACGTPELCVRDTCVGQKTDRVCCCTGDLCNSSSMGKVFVAVISLITIYLLK